VAPPPPPPELGYALRMDVSGLRPWELHTIEADDYDLIVGLRHAFEDEMATLARERNSRGGW